MPIMNNLNDQMELMADTCEQGLSLVASSDSSPTNEENRTPRDACVMIIDDESINIEIVKAYLEEEGFENLIATTQASQAMDMLREHRPDIVLLDIKMPEISGLELLRMMRSDRDMMMIPAIVLTAANDPQVKLQALRLGASDFLAKPVDPSELTLRLENVLAVKAYQDHLADYSEKLERQVQIRTEELVHSRQEAIHCLARAGEFRDDDTGRHVTRVGRYSALIAAELGFPQAAVDLIEQAAQLHDVGKIGIPDAILHKPGKLDPQEFEIIQEHCNIGRRIINPLSHEESIRLKTHTSVGLQIMGSTNSPVLRLASVIAATHHEKWDGTGYPKGLAGNAIPIEGRIVAVADVFDALSSARPYKEAFPLDRCLKILADSRSKHFDPRVLDAFLRRKDEAIHVREDYVDFKQDDLL
jgi:putative two-component system response regulator